MKKLHLLSILIIGFILAFIMTVVAAPTDAVGSTVQASAIENTDNSTAETSVNPDKTDLPQPSESVSGDYAYLNDLYWARAESYNGGNIGRGCNTANEIIFSSDGKFFAKGLGFHAASESYDAYVDVNIEGLGFTRFASYYGICETLSRYDISMAAIKFAVFGDGEKLWESETVKFGDAMKSMECDISGVKMLRLAVAGAPDISGGWGTWGGAVISKSGNITDDVLYSEISFDPVVTTYSDTSISTPTEAPSSSEPAKTNPGVILVCGSVILLIASVAVVVLKKRKGN